jgi:asparagine synthetase B (glutamine-hydrolysing)
LLTGKGPDEWLTGSDSSLADRLRRVRLRGLVGEVRTGAGGSDPRAMARHLWQYGLRPVLPPALLGPIRSAMGRTSCPAFIRRSFCRDIHLDERLRARTGRRPSFATAAVAENLYDGWQAHAYEIADRAMASVGLECRDPFDDRRVVEFALALPEEQRRQGELTKYVLRNAMTGLIPESVRTRRDKGNYSHLICEELRLQGGSTLFVDLELDKMGWVDGQQVLAMYGHLDRNYRDGNPAYHRHLWSLWLIISIERWLRATV